MKFFLIVIIAATGIARADAPPAKSSTCTACHGAAGISANDFWPNIAGQKMQYLIEELKEFRSGQRQDPLMTPISRMLTDRDIQDLAAYYASMKGP